MDYANKKLFIIDPYLAEKTKEEIIESHEDTLKKIEIGFLKPHFQKETRNPWVELNKSVIIPPAVPQQFDGWNCGCFLSQFARLLQ